MRTRLALGLFAAGLLLAGCDASSSEAVVPRCDFRNGSVLVLEAQSVPGATLLPCIDNLPAGWAMRDIRTERDLTEFRMDSDRLGRAFLTVTLTEACPAEDAGEPVLVPGGIVWRSIRADAAARSYTGEWRHVFEGGCVTYRFAAHGNVATLPANTERALSFVNRTSVDRFVRSAVGIGLDP